MALLTDRAARQRLTENDISELTRRATASTFLADNLTPRQLEGIDHVVRISAATAFGACDNAHQMLAAAFIEDRLAGYVIATVHSPDSRELDWLMVDPDFHGTGIAADLMRAGMDWLGTDKPMWLNVVRHNRRAIHFYERFGFIIDREAVTSFGMPQYIMCRRKDGAAA